MLLRRDDVEINAEKNVHYYVHSCSCAPSFSGCHPVFKCSNGLYYFTVEK
jgi:hypothetical protein